MEIVFTIILGTEGRSLWTSTHFVNRERIYRYIRSVKNTEIQIYIYMYKNSIRVAVLRHITFLLQNTFMTCLQGHFFYRSMFLHLLSHIKL